MTPVRVEAVDGPWAGDPGTVQAAATLVARGAVMGFLPDGVDTRRLDDALLSHVLRGLADQGVAMSRLVALGSWSRQDVRRVVDRALEQSEHSPMPSGEWPRLTGTLGEDLLSRLVGVSASSVRRYSSGARPTPQEVAARLHVLALVVADLAGGYNDYGVRRWFTAPARSWTTGRRSTCWGAPGSRTERRFLRLRAMAAGLVGSGAA